MPRLDLLAADVVRDGLAGLPRVALGDCTANGTLAHDDYFLAFKNRISGGLYPVLGNHDVGNVASGEPGFRTPAAAAAALGMPAKDYVVDLGFAALIVLGQDAVYGSSICVYFDDTLDWLDAQLLANPDKPCIVAAHAPLKNTVRCVLTANGIGGTSAHWGWYAIDESSFNALNPATASDAAIRAVLADNVNATAWISGHTHSVLQAPDIVKQESIGGRNFLTLTASSITPPGYDATHPVVSAFLTVLDDRMEVRWRNHGAHQWVGAGSDFDPLFTVEF